MASLVPERPPDREARLRVRRGAGVRLRRAATASRPIRPDAAGPTAGPTDAPQVAPGAGTPDDDTWDELTVPYADPELLAEWVSGFGADVVVLDPPDVRDAVVRRLRGVLGPRSAREVLRGAQP